MDLEKVVVVSTYLFKVSVYAGICVCMHITLVHINIIIHFNWHKLMKI